MRENGAITSSLLSKVIINSFITCHYFPGDGFWWWLLEQFITSQSDDYSNNSKVQNSVSVQVHITHEKKSDGHHLVMPVIITFQVMGPSLQWFYWSPDVQQLFKFMGVT